MKTLMALCAVGAFASAAQASISEVESNDTIATANFVANFDQIVNGTAADGTLTPGDVDWYEFSIAMDAEVVASAQFASSGGLDAPDGQLMLVDSTGTDVLAFDDNSGIGLLPALQAFMLPAGTYYIGVSGGGDITGDPVETDELFDGLRSDQEPHAQNFGYKLSLVATLVPSPGALALFGLAGVVGTIRRR